MLLLLFSIIAQVITDMHMLWLVKNYVISYNNHPAQGDYNTDVLIFKMIIAQFLDILEEATNKMEKNTVNILIII